TKRITGCLLCNAARDFSASALSAAASNYIRIGGWIERWRQRVRRPCSAFRIDGRQPHELLVVGESYEVANSSGRSDTRNCVRRCVLHRWPVGHREVGTHV